MAHNGTMNYVGGCVLVRSLAQVRSENNSNYGKMEDKSRGPELSHKNFDLNLTLCILMDSSFWFDTITWDSPLYLSRGVRL